MKPHMIVFAKTEGGLNAAVADTGYSIIPETVREFSSLGTFTDADMSNYDVEIQGAGWVALAEPC
jgi:hypothetical protein